MWNGDIKRVQVLVFKNGVMRTDNTVNEYAL